MELWGEVICDDWLVTEIFKLWLFAMWIVCVANKARIELRKLTPRGSLTVLIRDVLPIMTIANFWLERTLMPW